MRKFFYVWYFAITILTFIGVIYSYYSDKMKECLIYMMLCISVGVITIMLEPRKDKNLQNEVETMGLIILIGVLLIAVFFIFTASL